MLDFKLKIEKQHSHLIFMWTILIHIDSAFKYTQQGHKFSISHSYSYNTRLWMCLKNLKLVVCLTRISS